jgi:hypothetical protein
MEDMKTVFRTSVGKPQWKSRFWRRRSNGRIILKLILGTVSEGKGLVQLALDRIH